MSNLLKNILLLLIIFAVIGFALWYVTRTPDEETVDTGVTAVAGDGMESENPADVFASLLEKLSTVNFQGGNPIFNNDIFRLGLVSFRRDLPEIDQSRVNPFAPIEGNPERYVRYVQKSAPATATTSTSSFPVISTARATSSSATTTNR